MKYLIAVKLKDTRDVEIYEFNNKKDRMDFSMSLRGISGVEDIAYSQIDKEELVSICCGYNHDERFNYDEDCNEGVCVFCKERTNFITIEEY